MKKNKIILVPTLLLALGFLAGCSSQGSSSSQPAPSSSTPAATSSTPATSSSEPVVMYTVTFDTEGGSAIAPVQVQANSKVARPQQDPTPNDANYGFGDWYDAKTGGNKFDFDQLITKDTTIYARFEKKASMLAAKSFRHFTIYERITSFDFIVKCMYAGSDINYYPVYDFTIDGFNGEYTFTSEDVTAKTKSFTVRYKSGGVEVSTKCSFVVDALKVDFETVDDYLVATSNASSSGSIVIPSITVKSEKTKQVKAIKKEAFSGNTDITEVYISGNIEHINDGAFKNCSNITDMFVDFEGNDLFIGVSAFYSLSKLSTINFNGTTTEWNNYVAPHCDSGWKTGSTFNITCTDGTLSA